MTTHTSPGSPPSTHHPVQNPYAQKWVNAEQTVATLIDTINGVIATIDTARSNLNWQGGSEDYFQWQVARRHYYLEQNNSYLQLLRNSCTRALAAGSVTVVPHPQPGGAA